MFLPSKVVSQFYYYIPDVSLVLMLRLVRKGRGCSGQRLLEYLFLVSCKPDVTERRQEQCQLNLRIQYSYSHQREPDQEPLS
jgi:hypothetical protein